MKQPIQSKDKRQRPLLKHVNNIEAKYADNFKMTHPTFPNPDCKISD